MHRFADRKSDLHYELDKMGQPSPSLAISGNAHDQNIAVYQHCVPVAD